jgi:hypothetical protein
VKENIVYKNAGKHVATIFLSVSGSVLDVVKNV